MFWNKYPYTDFHELNLDWILARMMELHKEWDEFTAVNKITNAGAWDITKQYQAWTVVSDNNAGYISLQPVPAGVAISNTEYWGLIADYNILITDLSNRISTLEGQMAAVNNELAKLTRPRRFIMVGDSYNSITATPWVNVVSSLLGLTDTVTCAQGGYGFIPATKKWIDLLTNTSVPGGDDTITDILICGGANDSFGTLGNIPSAIIDFNDYAKGRFANLKNIYLGFCGNSFADATQSKNMRRCMYRYIDTAKSLGWKYLNNIESTLYDPKYMQIIEGYDYIHPNEDGVVRLAYNIAACLQTGSCENYTLDTGVIFDTNDALFDETYAPTFEIDEHIDNRIITTNWNNIQFLCKVNVSGSVVLGHCQEMKNAIPIGTYIPVHIFLVNTGVYYPTLLTVTANNELTLTIPANVTVQATHYFRIMAATNTYDLSVG